MRPQPFRSVSLTKPQFSPISFFHFLAFSFTGYNHDDDDDDNNNHDDDDDNDNNDDDDDDNDNNDDDDDAVVGSR